MKKKRDTSRLPFARELARVGFERERHKGCDPLIYEWDIGNGRRVDVQLWKDGNHRVSHSIQGCWATSPTSFKTIAQMHEAIGREAQRTDRPEGTSAKELYDQQIRSHTDEATQ